MTARRSPIETTARRSARWLVLAVYLISGVAFIQDLLRDNMLAYGMIYAPLVGTAVFHKDRASLWFLTAIACLMVVVGAFLPVVSSDLPDLIGNRFLSILAIGATAAFVRHARNIQERLAAETRRAEAAERIKTDVLTNLSHEIRTPLHTLLGVLSLTMAGSKPDQREALGRVRNDGRELLATIDNLIDLTQIEERELSRQAIDLSSIARDAADSARATARERQIDIALTSDRDPRQASAIGDSWAMRRILDNLLSNAVGRTSPGGTVSVSIARTDRTITASVSNQPEALTPVRNWPDDLADEEGVPAAAETGLALSRRLARAMDGRMTASNQPGLGATISLTLPAADPHAA